MIDRLPADTAWTCEFDRNTPTKCSNRATHIIVDHDGDDAWVCADHIGSEVTGGMTWVQLLSYMEGRTILSVHPTIDAEQAEQGNDEVQELLFTFTDGTHIRFVAYGHGWDVDRAEIGIIGGLA